MATSGNGDPSMPKPNLPNGILFAVVVFFTIMGDYAAAQDRGTIARTIQVGDLSRTYHLHVPTRLPKDKAVPLVLMFHGGGGTPVFAERESKFSALADRENFLAAYPEGFGKGWN